MVLAESTPEHRSALGILLILFGLVALLTPFITSVTITILIGAFILVSGGLMILSPIITKEWSWTVVLLGGLYLIGGVLLVADPLRALYTITFFLGAFFAADGVIKIVLSLVSGREQGWLYILFSGILSLILGLIVFLEFPVTATWLIGVLFGAHLVGTGIALILAPPQMDTKQVPSTRSSVA